MAEVLGKPSTKNMHYLFKLRENFKTYLKLVKDIHKDNHHFYKNAEETDQKDEIAIILDRIIQKNIEGEKEISNEQIINQITKYDVYYQENDYIHRRELNFLDKINFDEKEIEAEIETEWKIFFKNSNFEDIFSNDIDQFLSKLISKINKMEDLGIVISIINEDKIKNMGKMEYLIGKLRYKPINLINSSDSLKESKIKSEKLSALTNLFKIIYKYSQKMEKIEDILGKLDKESKHFVYMKLLESFSDDKALKEYIDL